MPLPSQQPRVGTRASSLGRGGGWGGGGRRRAKRRRVGAIVGLIVVVLLAWWFWPTGDGKTPLEPRQAGADSGSAVTPVRNDRLPGADGSPSGTDQGSALGARAEKRMTEAAANTPTTTTTEPRVTPPPAKPTQDEPVFKSPVAATNEPTTTPSDPPVQTPPPSAIPTTTGGSASQAMARADAALTRNDPVQARDILNRALTDRGTSESDRAALRERLASIAETLTFSPRVLPGDVTADAYTVQAGDVLAAIPRREGFRIDYRLIERLNKIANPNRIRVGQKLKVLYGPFHVVIDKSAFRMDLYADQRDTAGNRIYIRSFPVGLGEYGLTPVGTFRVAPSDVQEKLINPGWANPRTGEKFAPDDPKNPIGERWIPLQGTDDTTRDLTGYGIHGTIDLDSIGKEMSMGCIRMRPDDVALVYELLVPEKSTVQVVD